MILRVEQISRLPKRKHIIKNLNGKVLYNASVPKVFEGTIEIDDVNYKIITDEISKTIIYKEREKCGEINQKVEVTKKILFLPIGYEFNEISYDGKKYQMYESGLGANQHYFSIYEDKNTIAIIHKDDRVINYLNTYTVYAETDTATKLALICVMFLESTAFCDRTGGLGNGVVDSPYYTAQKALRERYDPTFIPQIKKAAGIDF